MTRLHLRRIICAAPPGARAVESLKIALMGAPIAKFREGFHCSYCHAGHGILSEAKDLASAAPTQGALRFDLRAIRRACAGEIAMKGMLSFVAAALAATLAAAGGANGLKRMYALDCGRLIAKDQSRWTPGVNAGRSREFSNNCYLFQHERGTLLWETGVPDSVAEHKDGLTTPNGAIVMFRDKTLKGQLESLGVKPDDITYVAISHAHGDHIGNAKAFAKSKTLMQKLEHESAMKMIPKPLNDDQNVETLSGDRDVFGDGSLTIISTPGHTPGHQSLLVKLPKTGVLILTGDLVHFQYMWDNKVVPPFNFNKEQSLASIERIARLLAEHKARLWIGHDNDITAKIDRAPKFYE